jgi:hypothetical protein
MYDHTRRLLSHLYDDSRQMMFDLFLELQWRKLWGFLLINCFDGGQEAGTHVHLLRSQNPAQEALNQFLNVRVSRRYT